eukprot:GHVS01107897.1.p1 GENE.GHVS01107897.1~~GHVS01107897.1.p1  ORF type:complete len:376 (+),score=60.16 GHVS01107897.1:228-1355(+)
MSAPNTPPNNGARLQNDTRIAYDASSGGDRGSGGVGFGACKLRLKGLRLKGLLEEESLDLGVLKELLWSGAPEEAAAAGLRAEAWQILLGYLPLSKERREAAAYRKRVEYSELLKAYYEKEVKSDTEQKLLRQIRVDVPRTLPGSRLFSHARTQLMMERALYTWAVRHPASGYVQGINDLITPFIACFCWRYCNGQTGTSYLDSIDLAQLSDEQLNDVEADSYWCLSKVLGHIQDNYTFGQPGIQRSVVRLKDIVKRVDEPLYNHLQQQGLDFLQFSFRWMNCLLMRELPMCCVVRLWDTYIAEQAEGFAVFHVYVCAVFLVYWSNQLKMMDFQQMMVFMQNFPTAKWTVQEMETLLAEAFVLKSLFHSSPKHLT